MRKPKATSYIGMALNAIYQRPDAADVPERSREGREIKGLLVEIAEHPLTAHVAADAEALARGFTGMPSAFEQVVHVAYLCALVDGVRGGVELERWMAPARSGETAGLIASTVWDATKAERKAARKEIRIARLERLNA